MSSSSSPPPLTPSFPGRRAWAWLGAGLLLGLVWCLGTRGLNEPDEGRYASMARAMVETGDWWEPRLSGYGHYDKPPLVYWATAWSFRLCGFNEWAARLPSLFGAVAALAGLGWLTWRLHGPRVAWWAVLVGGTLVHLWTCARLLTPDMLLTGWTTLAAGAWAEARARIKDGGKPGSATGRAAATTMKAGGRASEGDAAEGPPPSPFPWRWWALSLACWTLAWWTKATPALVPMLGLAVGTVVTGDRAGWRALRLPLLLPGTVLLGLPWYVAMVQAHPDLWNYFLGKELAGRLAGGAHRRGGPVLYYLPVSAAAWLPWWPLAAWAAWRTRAAPGGGLTATGWRRRPGVEGWVVLVGLLIFSLNGSKLPTYTLVLAPWVALVLARGVLRLPRPGRAAGAAVGAFALVVLPGAWVFPRWESRLGVNASVREVCRELDARGVGTALFDRHWPGAEFYRPGAGRVRFVADDRGLRERASDPGPVVPSFLPPRGWREVAGTLPGPVWTARYRKGRKSPFTATATAAPSPGTGPVVGEWELSPFPWPPDGARP